jgi:flagellar protein FlaJ
MATETDAEVPDADQAFAAIRDAYGQMEMPVARYLLLVLVPSVVFFAVTVAVVLVVELPPLVSMPIPLLGGLILVTAVIYPKLQVEQERTRLEKRLHLLITHMTVLSTTNIDRVEVFRRLSQEEEYGALSAEMSRVVQLVDAWNQSLDDALRRRAREVPSKPLSDFFDRLAYTLGAGQQLPDFLVQEQQVVIQNYVTIYEGALDNLTVMKDLYLSMILSMTFALVFAVVLPVLTGTDPTTTVSAVIVMAMFVQIGFTYAIYTVAPFDPIWYSGGEITPRSERTVRLALVAGVGLSALLAVYVALDFLGSSPVALASLLPGSSVPTPLYAVIPLTPLLLPGLVTRRIEQQIKGRDEEFPNFIRALGASESAKQSTTSAVLTDLRTKDFGPLTADINDLYKRLNMRIEPVDAWQHFTADAQSYLIQKFSEMYLVGRQMGGEPKQLGELISENMNEVLQLREQREQETITLIGLLYGITAASTFANFIGLQVVNLLSEMTLNLSTSEFDFSQLISTGNYDIPTIEFLLVVVILANALLSAMMIRLVDGGHKLNAYTHFVALSWLGAVVAVVTKVLVSTVISI